MNRDVADTWIDHTGTYRAYGDYQPPRDVLDRAELPPRRASLPTLLQGVGWLSLPVVGFVGLVLLQMAAG